MQHHEAAILETINKKTISNASVISSQSSKSGLRAERKQNRHFYLAPNRKKFGLGLVSTAKNQVQATPSHSRPLSILPEDEGFSCYNRYECFMFTTEFFTLVGCQNNSHLVNTQSRGYLTPFLSSDDRVNGRGT